MVLYAGALYLSLIPFSIAELPTAVPFARNFASVSNTPVSGTTSKNTELCPIPMWLPYLMTYIADPKQW